MIIKKGDGYWVLSDCRDKIIGGPYRTREQAEKVFRGSVQAARPTIPKSHIRSLQALDDERTLLH